MNNKGQSVLSEHVMIVFVVIAVVVAMSTYVQRALQARVHDARNYMVNSLISSSACDANCLAATGGNIGYEYEPYYTQTVSLQQHNEAEIKGETQGNAIGDNFYKESNEETNVSSAGYQLPPECAGAPNGKCNLVPYQAPIICRPQCIHITQCGQSNGCSGRCFGPCGNNSQCEGNINTFACQSCGIFGC